MSDTASSPAFDAAFRIIVGVEGGYVNDPNDPGGETKFGISKRAYPNVDIPNLTLEQAEAIYWSDYWLKAQCDKLPPALALVVFDSAVNAGVGTVPALLKAIQESLGVAQDGVIGPQTQAALAKADIGQALAYAHGARIQRQASLGNWPTYAKGWSRRLALIPYQAAVMAASLGSLPPTA